MKQTVIAAIVALAYAGKERELKVCDADKPLNRQSPKCTPEGLETAWFPRHTDQVGDDALDQQELEALAEINVKCAKDAYRFDAYCHQYKYEGVNPPKYADFRPKTK